MGSTPLPASESAAQPALVRAIDASLIFGPVWRLCRHSAVCRVGVRIWRSLSVPSSWLAHRWARTPNLTAFSRASRVARRSMLVRPVDRAFAAAPAVWQDSVTARLWTRATGPVAPWQQVRMIGVAVITAAIAHAVIGRAEVWYNRASLWSTMAVVVVGAVLMVASRPFADAWRDWR